MAISGDVPAPQQYEFALAHDVRNFFAHNLRFLLDVTVR